jgi:hypothetical protein
MSFLTLIVEQATANAGILHYVQDDNVRGVEIV